MNNRVQGMNGCFKEVSEATGALRWAGFCKAIGWIIFCLGFIISLFWKTFILFFICVAISFVLASLFWIFGAVLNAIGATAQSTTETTRLTYLYVQAALNEYAKNQPKEEKPSSHTYLPDTRWDCPSCGANNAPLSNVCQKCGKVLELLDD